MMDSLQKRMDARSPRARVAVDAKWEENKHPRGQPGNAGQFGPGGGKAAAGKNKKESSNVTTDPAQRRKSQVTAMAKYPTPEAQRATQKDLSGFLRMVASVQEESHLPDNMTAPARFVLNEGKQFLFDAQTYAGKRGRAHECYANAGRLALSNPTKTYVEGYVVVHGIPIEHAWVVDEEGKVQDPTITGPKGIGGYFGVPIKREYLNRQIADTQVWGLFGHRGNFDYLRRDPKTFVKEGLGERLPRDGTEKAPDRHSATRLLEKYGENITVEALLAKQPQNVGRAIRTAEKKLSESVPTNASVLEGGFKNPDGSYTLERIALHAKILSGILTQEAVAKAKPAAGEAPTFTMIGGRAGSGKSYFTQAGIVGDNNLVLDNDSIKAQLPGFAGWNAGLYHEEASDIFEMADSIARGLGLNVAHDATMKTYTSAQRRVDTYKEQGYKIRGLYMFCPPQEAAQRAIDRFMMAPKEGSLAGSTGRYVPPSYVLSSHTNEASFDALRDSTDSWEIYTSFGTQHAQRPELVQQGHR